MNEATSDGVINTAWLIHCVEESVPAPLHDDTQSFAFSSHGVPIKAGCLGQQCAVRRSECHDSSGQSNTFMRIRTKGCCWSVMNTHICL